MRPSACLQTEALSSAAIGVILFQLWAACIAGVSFWIPQSQVAMVASLYAIGDG